MFSSLISAQNSEKTADSNDADKQELKAAVASPKVEEELAEPYGASIRILDDESWKIFGIGTTACDFDDPDSINDAKQESVMRAKAQIVKFLQEKASEKSFVKKS